MDLILFLFLVIVIYILYYNLITIYSLKSEISYIKNNCISGNQVSLSSITSPTSTSTSTPNPEQEQDIVKNMLTNTIAFLNKLV